MAHRWKEFRADDGRQTVKPGRATRRSRNVDAGFETQPYEIYQYFSFLEREN
jgi:hypothetical protein